MFLNLDICNTSLRHYPHEKPLTMYLIQLYVDFQLILFKFRYKGSDSPFTERMDKTQSIEFSSGKSDSKSKHCTNHKLVL